MFTARSQCARSLVAACSLRSYCVCVLRDPSVVNVNLRFPCVVCPFTVTKFYIALLLWRFIFNSNAFHPRHQFPPCSF